MPIFKQETRTIELPESKAKIEVYTKFTYGQIIKVQEKNLPDENDAKLELASVLIKDWDFVDEKGDKLPISAEIVKNLSFADGNHLISEVNKLLAEKKT